MQNEVSFKTGEIPRFTSKSNFPYERLRKSLLALQDTTKCVILEDKTEINYNNLIHLRTIMRKDGWWVKMCKHDKLWQLWLVKDGGTRNE